MKIIAKNSGHKAAQRRFKAEVCLLCGVKKRLQRHHKDQNPTNNSPNNIMILCQTCHTQIHMIDGTWGRKRTLKNKECPVCGEDFRPKKTQTVFCQKKTCKKPQRDMLGRFCAKERLIYDTD
jgi:hypothetical protein